MTTTDAIVGFILARIAGDEAVAHEATVPTVFEPFMSWKLLAGTPQDMAGAVLAEPTRVLAACKAKRDLVELALGIEDLRTMGDPDAPGRPVGADILRIMATEWSTHPDYLDAMAAPAMP